MLEINWFEELFLQETMWGLLGPFALVVLSYYLTKKDKFLGVIMFLVDCLFAASYLDLVGATPAYWWHITIILFGGIFFCLFPLIWDRR